MSKTEPAPRVRKKPARHRDVVFGAIDERLDMLTAASNVDGQMDVHMVAIHSARLTELMDELRRSLNGREDSE